MKTSTKFFGVLGSLAPVVLMGVVAGVAIGSEKSRQQGNVEVALSPATIVNATNIAAKAQSGDITKIEARKADGRTVVFVTVTEKSGIARKVSVDAASGRVLAVEDRSKSESREERQERVNRGPLRQLLGNSWSVLSEIPVVPAG